MTPNLKKAAEKPPIVDAIQGGGTGADWDFCAWADNPTPY
jgi:hypothetical protein